jgi:hypothetical protein
VNVIHAQFVNVMLMIESHKNTDARHHRGAAKKKYKCFHIAQETIARENAH